MGILSISGNLSPLPVQWSSVSVVGQEELQCLIAQGNVSSGILHSQQHSTVKLYKTLPGIKCGK